MAYIAPVPSGSVLPFAGTTAPSGWLACDGAAVSRTTYSGLFSVIGTSYGTGDGSTTFNLPDFRGRFPRFNDAMFGGSAAGRDSGRVHGSSQTQTTAPNGLGVTSSDLSHNHTFSNQPTGFAGYASTSPPNAFGNGMLNMATGTTSTAGLNHAHNLYGDAETRPINLSINAIIKV